MNFPQGSYATCYCHNDNDCVNTNCPRHWFKVCFLCTCMCVEAEEWRNRGTSKANYIDDGKTQHQLQLQVKP